MSNYYPSDAKVYEAQKACQWMQERGNVQNLPVGFLLVTNRETPADEVWKCLGEAKGFDFAPYGDRVLEDCEWSEEDFLLAAV